MNPQRHRKNRQTQHKKHNIKPEGAFIIFLTGLLPAAGGRYSVSEIACLSSNRRLITGSRFVRCHNQSSSEEKWQKWFIHRCHFKIKRDPLNVSQLDEPAFSHGK